MSLRSFVSSFVVGDSSIVPDTPIYGYLWPLEHVTTMYAHVNKGPTRCNNMQTFIHCHVTLHVLGVTHPSSGVLKTVSATSGVCHGNGTVTSFHRGLIRTGVSESPDDGCVTPETCRVTWQ